MIALSLPNVLHECIMSLSCMPLRPLLVINPSHPDPEKSPSAAPHHPHSLWYSTNAHSATIHTSVLLRTHSPARWQIRKSAASTHPHPLAAPPHCWLGHVSFIGKWPAASGFLCLCKWDGDKEKGIQITLNFWAFHNWVQLTRDWYLQ